MCRPSKTISIIFSCFCILLGCSTYNTRKSQEEIERIQLLTLSLEVARGIEKELRLVFPESPSRDLEIVLAPKDKHDQRYPSFWHPQSIKTGINKVSLVEKFDFEGSWWNFKPKNENLHQIIKKLSLKQQLIIILSHEITHLYMHPSSYRGWFQEMAAMNIGFHIALRVDPSLDSFIQNIPEVKSTLGELVHWDYKSIYPPNVDKCREFELKAYFFGRQHTIKQLVLWVKKVKTHFPIDYDTHKDVLASDKSMKARHDKIILKYKPF